MSDRGSHLGGWRARWESVAVGGVKKSDTRLAIYTDHCSCKIVRIKVVFRTVSRLCLGHPSGL